MTTTVMCHTLLLAMHANYIPVFFKLIPHWAVSMMLKITFSLS